MLFKDLVAVNATIKKTAIKGKEYAEVNERIKAFRQLFPNGTITTEIIDMRLDDKGKGVVVIKATALNEQGAILGTGHAYEKEGSSFINATSYIENAETSAVGRALGMLGIGIDTSIASYEEVANAIEQQAQPKKAPARKKAEPEQAPEPETPVEVVPFRDQFRKFVKEHKLNDNQVLQIIKECNLKNDSADSEWENGLMYAFSLYGGVQ